MPHSRSQAAPPPLPENTLAARQRPPGGPLAGTLDHLAGTGRDALEALERRVEDRPLLQRAVLFVRSRAARVRVSVRATPEPREIRDASRLVSPEPQSGPHVLVVSFRGWTTHVAYEYLVGHGLRRHGARCSYAVCGGGLPICELGRPRATFADPCRECHAYVTRMLDAGGFPYVLVDELVPENERVELARLVQGTDDLWELEVAGIRLAPLVVRSTLWATRRGLAARDLDSLREFREFVESAAIVATAFARLLERDEPDTIVMTNGLFFAEAVMWELATKREIRVVSYEFPGGGVFIADDHPAGLYDTTKLWATRGKRSPTEAERERVMRELAARRAGTSATWRTYDPDAADPTTDADGRTRLVLFTNVPWETAVALRDVGFADMYEWLDYVVNWAEPRNDVTLDIRVHPGETRVRGFETKDSATDYLAERFPTLPAHIRVHDAEAPVNSYALIEQAAAVLVYSTSIGLEAAALGKPTLVAAEAHFGGKGFTYDIESPEHLRSLLEHPDELGLDTEQHDHAVTYAHLFFFDSIVELRSMSERWRGKPVFEITNPAEVDDDPAVELICRLAVEEAVA